MATPSGAMAQPALRTSAADVKARFLAGEKCTILDTRSDKAWEESHEKAAGAMRVPPDDLHVQPSWPQDRLTVAYCT